MTTLTERLSKIFHTHFEWVFLVGAIGVMALMDPTTDAASWCLYEWLGISFCPGEGLGHSIAWFFRGDWTNAWEAHPVGPFAVFIMSGRVIYLLRNSINTSQTYS